MKKLYSSVGIIAMVLFSNSAFSQEKINETQIQHVLSKLQLLGKQNPAGKEPLDKLSKEEFAIYKAYQLQEQKKNRGKYPYGITDQDLQTKVTKNQVQPILDKINQLGDSQLAFPDHLFTNQELKLLRIYELQNMKSQKSLSSSLLLDKAFALNSRNTARPFGTMPLVPPHTLTPTGTVTNVVYADDVAGDGKLYGLDNTNRTLVRINDTGVATTIGNLVNIPVAATLAGLSWNSSNNTMYALAGTQLYSVNLTTGEATSVAPITGATLPIWLEIDNMGNAYSADISTDVLLSINLSTGVATTIGALGVNLNFAQEADFNKETNQLYMASYTGGGVGGIYTINTSTGAATLVGDTTPDNAEYTMFSITNTTEPVLNKAFVKNSYAVNPVVFGTIPLTPPHTITTITNNSQSIFADDLAGDGNLYGLNSSSGNLVKIYSDGTMTNVGPLTNLITGDTPTGLSWNRVTNMMYAASTDGTEGTLYSVDLTSGTLTVVGTMVGTALPIWLEIDNNGNAYSADISTDKLYSINLATGAATEIGSLGVNIQFAQEADFNTSNNMLYMAGYLGGGSSNIYTVDTATGLATLVGATTGNEFTMFTIADTLPDAPIVPPLTCGNTFLDSGGAAGDYANNEDIITYFAPSTAGESVKITFTQVEVERSTGTGTIAGCWDYLSIYNGPTISSPALAEVKCGETAGPPSVASSLLSVGDSFTSTDPSGKLTVRFRSDDSVPKAGWSATVSCAVLAVDNVNASKFSYYPNPTSGILNINASNKIDQIEVYNTAGQKVLSFAPKTDKSEINMSSLPKGLYFVKALVDGKVVTNKVIKK